ncbi:hypothetical protein ACIRSU_34830 [Streptomyces sp. NPDC101160]|uniref:hypothetical protein n=1 Tax=Streptomyces sp. NPDC101160 TaxID=3366118 RepID=UPI003830EB56
MSDVVKESIAAEVGAGIDGQGRFRPVAAWAWMWRNFEALLPDVTGAAWQSDPAARPYAGTERLTAEVEAYARYVAHGPW